MTGNRSAALPTLANFMLVLLLALTACSSPLPTKIKRILDDPRQFDGKVVMISGEVTQAYNIVVAKGFAVKDETGEIPVIADRSVPAIGARIRVRGRVSQALSVRAWVLSSWRKSAPGAKPGDQHLHNQFLTHMRTD